MLDALRAATQNWFGRIIMGLVMGLLILAFGLWGIADIFRGFGANDLVRIGSDTITVEAYRDAYQTELQQLEQRARRAITNEQARSMGLDREILARLISQSVLDQAAHRLGLALSDHALAEEIIQDDDFKGSDGKFDRQLFESRLQGAGLTEQRFVAEQRQSDLRRQIITALTDGLAPPKAMIDAVHRYYNETRSIDYILLPQNSVGLGKPPTEASLKSFYEARRATYRTREYRKILVLAVTLKSLSEQLAKTAPISEADVRKHYEAVKADRFVQPEKRQIEQIPFATEAAATAAEKKLAGGETFDALVKGLKLTSKDVELGTVTKASMVDPAIAAAAFSLPQGQVSKPVKGEFRWVILRVDKIVPSVVIPFEKVELPLRQEMGLIRAHSEISKLHDKIEDLRASGKSLTEAAKAVGLNVRTIPAVDAQGYDQTGKPVPDLPDPEALLKAVFASDVGVDNEPISTPDGGSIWFEVASIDPAHQQSFTEVKPAVTAAWIEDQQARELSLKADELAKKLAGGATIAALAADNHLAVQHKDGIKRSGGAGLSQSEVTQIFNQKVGGSGSAADQSGGRMIFKVLDATVPPIDPKAAEFKKILADVKSGLGEDVVGQYLSRLEHEFGLKVNQQALRTALGSE
jgi:peptidyl-prolyl cis-trans isomerase D